MEESKPQQYVCDNEQLISEWDFEKNDAIGLDPTKILCGANKKVWWLCSKGHSYQARLDSRKRGSACPYCLNRKVSVGENDALTILPHIKDAWDYERNYPLLPQDIVAGSRKKVYFICKHKHSYQMAVGDFQKGYACPICAGKKIIPGVNDFASFDKRLLSEWDYERNDIDPTTISPNYYRKVWWIGQCGHNWQAIVYTRTKMGTNCPICSEERHASVSEKAVLYYLRKSGEFGEILENYRHEDIGLELDIFIPAIKTAIEYDGERWHRDIQNDYQKDIACEEKGIRLIRLRELGCPFYGSTADKIAMANNKTKGIEQGILTLFQLLSIKNIDINIERDMPKILTMINFMVKENSLLTLHPELCRDWHPNKNGNLKPEHTKPSSNKKVWWRCPMGHEYQLQVCARTERGNGCPICSNHQVLFGFNDLKTLNPTLANEWNYAKNGTLRPEHVTRASGKKVWWICDLGHEWENSISHRANGQNCPYCSGHRILKGFNDFATLNPGLLEEWNYDSNTDIRPDEVSRRSGKKVWWQCKKCGLKWQATIDKRVSGRGCPSCSKRKQKQ